MGVLRIRPNRSRKNNNIGNVGLPLFDVRRQAVIKEITTKYPELIRKKTERWISELSSNGKFKCNNLKEVSEKLENLDKKRLELDKEYKEILKYTDENTNIKDENLLFIIKTFFEVAEEYRLALEKYKEYYIQKDSTITYRGRSSAGSGESREFREALQIERELEAKLPSIESIRGKSAELTAIYEMYKELKQEKD
jgi:hypothetical protein